MHFRFTIAALFFLVLNGFSQNGTVSGTITEQSNGEISVGAVVTVDSMPKYGAVADFDGKYSIKIPAGTYSLTCHYTGYPSVKITQVKVEAGKTTPLNFIMTAQLDSNNLTIIYDQRPTG